MANADTIVVPITVGITAVRSDVVKVTSLASNDSGADDVHVTFDKIIGASAPGTLKAVKVRDRAPGVTVSSISP